MACASGGLNSDLLTTYIQIAEDFIKRCERTSIPGATKLKKKCLAELKFLQTLTKKPSKAGNHLGSSNLGHFAAVLHAVENLPAVTNIMKPMSYPGRDSLPVDVIAYQGHLWVKVIARKAQALHLVWAGQGQFGEKTLINQAKDYLKLAELHPVNFRTPKLCYAFYSGVTHPMAEALSGMGVLVTGERVDVSEEVQIKLSSVYDLDNSTDSDLDSDCDFYPDSDLESDFDLHLDKAGDSSQIKVLSQLNDHKTDLDFHGDLSRTNVLPQDNSLDPDKRSDPCRSYGLDPHLNHLKQESNISSSMKEDKETKLLSDESCGFMDDDANYHSGQTDVFDSVTQITASENSSNHDLLEHSKGDSFPSTDQSCDSKLNQAGNKTNLLPESNNLLLNKMTSLNVSEKITLASEDKVSGSSNSEFGLSGCFNYHFFDGDAMAHYLNIFRQELVSLEKTDTMGHDNVSSNVIDSSPINKVNLDITALIALISAITHGRCYFIFEENVLSEQAAEERRFPVLPKIKEFLKGKELYTCQTALKAFTSILDTLGGESEKRRAQELLHDVTVVPDQPSQRTQQLPVSSKIKHRSKVIFGTGDQLQMITLTANSGFIRAARNQGVSFTVHLHAARALTEEKEVTAKQVDPVTGEIL